MTLLYYHDDFLLHDTGRHPECAERVQQVARHLQATGTWQQCTRPDVPLADSELIGRAHERGYVARMRQVAEAGGARVEADTVMSRQSFQAASRAVGAAVDAVQRIVTQGTDKNAFCLVRPPGHHALYDAPMGFCLFNNIAVAAEYAIDVCGLSRVLIIDWDVHHGNGTQDRFWENERVGFFSVHRSPFYPGSGAASETGQAAGLGTTANLPLRLGVSRREYLQRVTGELGRFADRIEPELILLSAGFDSHRLDPVGSLGLETEDFLPLTQFVTELASTHCDGRLVSLLEGGYNTAILPECVALHLGQLLAVPRK